jgi:3'-phosphoadenosine 5'-phosphosulfate sulfotransferase (PAPS reductase)/FAD synthetase
MDCEVCKGHGDVLGAICAVCAGGTNRGYDGIYMSWGGGVQSTALAYMCIERHPDLMRVTGGNLPSLFIFADTGEEPRAVYEHIERVRVDLEQAGFLFSVVRKPGKLSDTIHKGRLDIPLWTVSQTGKRGPMRRACTFDYKAKPLDKAARKAFGIDLRKKARPIPLLGQWYGISTDEAQRVRTSTDRWRQYLYPLVLMGWSRDKCVQYLESKGINTPKSACVFCPFRSNALWADLPEDELNYVAGLEDIIREKWIGGQGYIGKLKSLPSFHSSGIPIREKPWVKTKTDEETEGFNNECSGACGV